ncbi:MAG: hypothetical protein AAFV93_11555 [Chloroflexota bacterium]
MKRLASLLVLIVVAIAIVPSFLGQTQDSNCQIPENYSEAAGENVTSQIRVFAFLGNDGIWDSDADTISLTFAQMVSIREYYEDARETLPDCAQALNTAYLRVTTAMTDVLAYNWALQANENRRNYFIAQTNEAKEKLNEEWATLSDLDNNSVFETE